MNNQPQKTVIIIAGPTAVGKTSIAIQLAKILSTSIISADSRQCYHEMNIGTACPTKEEMNGVKHYFIQEKSIVENISAADYEMFALKYLNEIFQKNDVAIVCGGTGLYLKALTDGLDEMPKIDVKIDKDVNQFYQEKGMKWLQETIKEEDREFYEQGEIQNPARLIRALVFKRSTGVSINHYKTGKRKKRNFKIIKVALLLPRNILYERINQRVEDMMQHGLLEEVNYLLPYKQLKNLQTVGYTELFDFLDGQCSLKEAIDKIKQRTRNYAKRQLTWFKKDETYHWLEADESAIEKALQLLNSNPNL